MESIDKGEDLWVLATAELKRLLITNAKDFWQTNPTTNASTVVCWGLVAGGTLAQDAPADFSRALKTALEGLSEGIRKMQKLRHDGGPPQEYQALTELEKICSAMDATRLGVATGGKTSEVCVLAGSARTVNRDPFGTGAVTGMTGQVRWSTAMH